MGIDVVIVTYNSAATVGRALSSCRSCNDIASVVVVDNASRDGLAAAAAEGADRVIVNEVNEGFARAVNQGVAVGEAELVLLLNPDAEIGPEALAALVGALADDPAAVMAGPVLLEPAGPATGGAEGRAGVAEGAGRGDRQACGAATACAPARRAASACAPARDADGRPGVLLGARRFSTVLNRTLWWLPLPRALRPGWATPEYGHPASLIAATRPAAVDYLWGTALLVRRSFLSAIGGLDERFFMYSEDEDLGRAARVRDRRVLLVPQARVAHIGGASTGDRAWALARTQAANRLLLEKWEGGKAAAVFWAAVGPALTVRAAALRLAGRHEQAREAARTRRFLRAARAEVDAVAARREPACAELDAAAAQSAQAAEEDR
jgi:GT2 family glycosyltransferase